MRYSKNFERDFKFYTDSIGVFDFCGTAIPNFIAEKGEMQTKEAFYKIDSGDKIYTIENRLNKLNFIDAVKVVKCDNPSLFMKLLLVKSAINFQIKEWAQGRADGTLPLIEFSKRQMSIKYPGVKINEDCKTLVWENKEPVYYRDIETQYNLPEWVINAVEAQKSKYYN